jgi:hypothetical protein
MTWNYRLTCRIDSEMGEQRFEVREVYYKDRTEEVTGWSADPAYPSGATPEELVADLAAFCSAVNLLDLRKDISPPVAFTQI